MSISEMGHQALSVPFGGGGGAKQRWIETEFEALERFDKIYLCMDADEEGRLATTEIANRLGFCRIYNRHRENHSLRCRRPSFV